MKRNKISDEGIDEGWTPGSFPAKGEGEVLAWMRLEEVISSPGGLSQWEVHVHGLRRGFSIRRSGMVDFPRHLVT